MFSGQFAWVFVLAGGFLIVGPMLAMGLYEAGRQLEVGETLDVQVKPTPAGGVGYVVYSQITLVRR